MEICEDIRMFKVIVKEFTIPQRNGESPDVEIIRTQYIPIPRAEASKILAVQHAKRGKRGAEPTDYGITETQFEDILDKASQPIEKDHTDKGKQ
jgi:hypothetical protein